MVRIPRMGASDTSCSATVSCYPRPAGVDERARKMYYRFAVLLPWEDELRSHAVQGGEDVDVLALPLRRPDAHTLYTSSKAAAELDKARVHSLRLDPWPLELLDIS